MLRAPLDSLRPKAALRISMLHFWYVAGGLPAQSASGKKTQTANTIWQRLWSSPTELVNQHKGVRQFKQGNCRVTCCAARVPFAQGELEVLLDLVAAVEAGQALAVANVPPRKSTLEGLTSTRALLLQTKQQQLQARRALQHLHGLGWDGLSLTRSEGEMRHEDDGKSKCPHAVC